MLKFTTVFDLSDNIWTSFVIPDEAKPIRAFAGQWTHEDFNSVYTFGGVEINCGQSPVFPLLQDLWRYNVTSNSWTNLTVTMTGTPGCRVGGAYARVGDDDVYLHGGLNCFFGAENDLWKYNIPTNTWTQIQTSLHNDTLRPHGRFASQMVWSEDRNCLLIANGDTLEGVPLADVWNLDLSSFVWTKIVDAGDSIIGDNVQFCAFTRGKFLYQAFGDRDEADRCTNQFGYGDAPSEKNYRIDFIHDSNWEDITTEVIGEAYKIKSPSCTQIGNKGYLVGGHEFRCSSGRDDNGVLVLNSQILTLRLPVA